MGGAAINLTFLNVATPGYTSVTAIDPTSAGALPGGYQLAGSNLAFEITTTASYTEPIIIGFTVPGVDAATLAQLRVLHNAGNGLVVEPVANPANAAPQTIYASVTSLSPFVLAKAVDTIPPTIRSVTASPSSIWPPNKKMVPVTLAVDTTDASGVACRRIVSVTSNETGSGQWQMTNNDLTLNLQADRNGSGNGRVYTITVECKDRFNNSSTKAVTVKVPHDQGK